MQRIYDRKTLEENSRLYKKASKAPNNNQRGKEKEKKIKPMRKGRSANKIKEEQKIEKRTKEPNKRNNNEEMGKYSYYTNTLNKEETVRMNTDNNMKVIENSRYATIGLDNLEYNQMNLYNKNLKIIEWNFYITKVFNL